MTNFFGILLFVSFVALLIGLVSPRVFFKIFQKVPTRWLLVKIFGGIVVMSFIAIGITAPKTQKEAGKVDLLVVQEKQPPVSINTNKTLKETEVTATIPTKSVTNTNLNTAVKVIDVPDQKQVTAPLPNNRQNAKVLNVIDGDTVLVEISGVRETIRIIGINTPETVDPRKPVECFGKEASIQAKKLLDGQIVQLETDVTQGERDKYSRLLRYVFLVGNTDFGKQMIFDGYAYEYTYAKPYKYQQPYKAAQSTAQATKRGLWSTSTCNGQKTSTSPTNVNTSPTPPSTPSSTNSNSSSNPSSSCDIKGNIATTGEKIYHLPTCGSYSKTVIDTSKGERWFCSEQEAVTAGWRKALNCQ